MKPQRDTLPPARMVALVLIAALAMGLIYVRLARGDKVITVPEGAKAGDLVLEPCRYPTEDGDLDADCGTLVVPENSANPRSRLIALPVTRIHARADHPSAPIFLLWGGPGITNMSWPQASRFVSTHDVVLVGYRGVDGSVRLDCPEVDSALKHSTDLLADASFRAYGDAFHDCADRLTGEGVDLAGYGLPPQVDDLEAARRALNYGRIDLLSESAGTRTAMIYAWRYPESIHRSVMVGVNPPGNFLWDPQTNDEQIARYADHCSKDSSCSRRSDNLVRSLTRTNADMPERYRFLPINESNVRVFSFYGLMETTRQAAPLNASMTLDSWLSAARGDASGLWFLSLAGDLSPIPFVWGHYAAAARLDTEAAREYFASAAPVHPQNFGSAGSAFAWGGGRLIDGWPSSPGESAYSQIRAAKVETLLISGELDTSTPPQVATRELLPYLPNGHQVILPGFGHTATFWADKPAAGTRLIITFLDTGRVDDSLYESQSVDFTPTVTFETLGKITLAVMLGLPLLTLLSLIAIARRVRKRGCLGRRASAVLRAFYPVILGPAGWLLGVLVVTTTMPHVPLDSASLTTVAVGLPTATGLYLAWVHTDRPATGMCTSFAAAAGGALVGAWLGFNATGGLVGVMPAIVGAALAANLVLIILDISMARSGRPAVATTSRHPAQGRQLRRRTWR